jgi:ABC-type antimicrobial peptide transport system permease subunit
VPTTYACRTEYANPALAFLVRTRGGPTALAETVRAKIKELEPLRAVYDVATLEARIGDEYAQDRLRTVALALFAGTALSLACLGVYGTLSYVVSLRRREVGLRMALGALQGKIVTQFLLRALRVVGAACVVGLVLSFAFTRALSGMLYDVSPSDPITLSAVILLVAGVATLAAILPAVRASRIDPMQALREE